MKLPNANRALIDRRKLVDYLLSSTHPVGKSKSRFFGNQGYSAQDPGTLEKGLMEIARGQDVVATVSSPHGVKHVVDGILSTPQGNRVPLRTVWVTETGRDYPRFVTAYPT